jgi:hypothetical protein
MRSETRSVMVGGIEAVAAGLILWAMVALGAAASGGPPLRPDPQLTPGATLEVTITDICVPGYTKKVRDVPDPVKGSE